MIYTIFLGNNDENKCNFFDTMRETFDFCPNKTNQYHVCTNFCEHKWKLRVIEPDVSYLRKRKKMLKKYPLTDKWEEMYDKGKLSSNNSSDEFRGRVEAAA